MRCLAFLVAAESWSRLCAVVVWSQAFRLADKLSKKFEAFSRFPYQLQV